MSKNKFYRVFIYGKVTDQVYYDYQEAVKAKNEENSKGVVVSFTNEEAVKEYEKELLSRPACIELDKQPSKNEITRDPKLRAQIQDQIAKQIKEDEANGYTVIFTDGSNNEEISLPSYGAIIYTPEEHIIKGVITDEKYKGQNNYAGEFFAVLKTLEYCEENGIEKLSFFVDLQNSYKEFYGCYGKLENRKKLDAVTILFNEKVKEYQEKGIEMKFSWCPSHIAVPQNEAVDDLADDAIREYQATMN